MKTTRKSELTTYNSKTTQHYHVLCVYNCPINGINVSFVSEVTGDVITSLITTHHPIIVPFIATTYCASKFLHKVFHCLFYIAHHLRNKQEI